MNTLINGNHTLIKYSELHNIINKLHSSNVVRSRFEFAKLLDGEVNNILFLPHDIDT